MTNYQIQSYGMSLSFKTCVVAEIWQPLHNMNYIDRFVYFFTRKRNSSGLLLYPSIQLIKTWRWKRSSVAWIQTLSYSWMLGLKVYRPLLYKQNAYKPQKYFVLTKDVIVCIIRYPLWCLSKNTFMDISASSW